MLSSTNRARRAIDIRIGCACWKTASWGNWQEVKARPSTVIIIKRSKQWEGNWWRRPGRRTVLSRLSKIRAAIGSLWECNGIPSWAGSEINSRRRYLSDLFLRHASSLKTEVAIMRRGPQHFEDEILTIA